MEGGENHEFNVPIEFNTPRRGRKLAVLRLHHSSSLQSDVDASVDLNCKTVLINYLVT
jgi:hypothetical protein